MWKLMLQAELFKKRKKSHPHKTNVLFLLYFIFKSNRWHITWTVSVYCSVRLRQQPIISLETCPRALHPGKGSAGGFWQER